MHTHNAAHNAAPQDGHRPGQHLPVGGTCWLHPRYGPHRQPGRDVQREACARARSPSWQAHAGHLARRPLTYLFMGDGQREREREREGERWRDTESATLSGGSLGSCIDEGPSHPR